MKETAIKENHLYLKAFRQGGRFVGKTVAVYVLKDYAAKRLMLANPEKKYLNRLGLSVTKKVGGAVGRNRAKRIIRAAYRQLVGKKKLKTGYLIVISAKPEIAGKSSQDVYTDLSFAFKKLDMYLKEQTP
ncbi:MAG: ribonuclease P protein component [Clostridia bacterium]|nr:ribonuclease P protein component [Clostridia bacterium]MBQ2256451.1 ribonuclease P protein component [Clostridia bacterium]MBQ5363220.1 ribonuclease P protein component [Clostridia bacterium]MBQ5793062.1 ribonuclease P protein component [Clostridia bacterium]